MNPERCSELDSGGLLLRAEVYRDGRGQIEAARGRGRAEAVDVLRLC